MLMFDEQGNRPGTNALPNNQKTAKIENGFRLYRDSPNDAWKSLGNYDFKNRDSGIHGTVRPHPQGVGPEPMERVLDRGGKRRRKTKRKRRKKTRKRQKEDKKKTKEGKLVEDNFISIVKYNIYRIII